MKTDVLYYGDNLDILRRYIPDESVDLVYLDPPFNSNRDYNVIFKDESGRKSDAQLLAFEDTWHWGPSAEATYAYLTNTARHEGRVPNTVSTIVAALRAGVGENQMMAYLVEMAVRLVELRRVLKPTGSLYLHCDPTASHYLKLVLDAIFGPKNFVNEIIWKRSTAHSDRAQGSRHFGRLHDVVLVYAKSDLYLWNQLYEPLGADYAASHYPHVEPGSGRRYGLDNITGPGGAAKGNPEYEVMGVRRYWRYSRDRMQELIDAGRIIQPSPGAVPRFKRYLDESAGRPIQDVWDDIAPVNSQAKERLGWGTQKPLTLLERIVSTSSNPGDLVLDPFCGCGTALVAAQKLDRRWIGIDITYLSIAVMRARLKDSFGLLEVEVIGQPTEVEGARQLAASPDGRYQFQWWALNLVDAKPLGGVEKKGADRGIDGLITFTDLNRELHSVLVSVKSGHVTSAMLRDLKGTLDREKGSIGLFITLEEPSREMRLEADTAGLFHSELWKRDYPRIQILSIRELLEEGKKPQLPPFVLSTYQEAERIVTKQAAEQAELFGS
ncbi:MAG: restriction endonuclease [Chloroflexi bacterium]|nr:restriction endonuclease [Chloroflexota bacterium]MBF6606835.1 restriction endonuclease [Chloroflexota bacterium]